MAVVRATLALVLGVIGALLGYQVGVYYVETPAIQRILVNFPTWRVPNLLAFIAGGLILGLWSHGVLLRQIAYWTESLKKMPPDDKIAFIIGALVGILFTFLLTPLFSSLLMEAVVPIGRLSIPIAPLVVSVIGVILVFLGIQGMLSMKSELRKILAPQVAPAPPVEEGPSMEGCKILDTNVVIDGRIADICETGFLEGCIYVPGFVLDELQQIADSSDALKRARGRRGLDILNQMRKKLDLAVRNHDDALGDNDHGPVDNRLVKLAKALKGIIVTNDFNLNQVAQLQGVRVLNVNELANALKPAVLPGEELIVTIMREGKEAGQGVAYLDDGTMVVVERGRELVGETVPVVVGSVLQTVQGKLIFGTLREDQDRDDALLGRNMRNYGDRRRRRPEE